MKKINRLLKPLTFSLLALFSQNLLLAQEDFSQFMTQGGGSAASGGDDQKAKKEKSIAELTKKHRKIGGIFTFFQDSTTADLKMLISGQQLDKEFIHFTYAENGSPVSGLYRGSYRGSRILTFVKHFDKIEIILQNTAFYFDPENPISKASQANISRAIVATEKILAHDKANNTYLIDVTKLFKGEQLHQIKPSSNPSANPFGFKLGRLDAEKTKIRNIKNYPQNADIIVEYVYSNPAPLNGGSSSVTDARNVSVLFQHSFIAVPENDFKPRLEDPRVGFFTDRITDMTSTSPTPYKDQIHRWHLVKKDPESDLSEPVEPIVFWIENTTPYEYRQTIKEAGEKWNEAFEKAGFKNALRVEIMPDDAEWDAGDIRYNVIRWTSSAEPPFNGYGPSFVNPRTGQILGADIMIEFAAMTRRLNEQKLFDAINEENHAALHFEQSTTSAHEHTNCCQASSEFQHQFLLGQAVLGQNMDISDYMKGAIHYLILHEIGHTLGLMHNMKASQLHSPDQLQDKALTEKVGLVGSVMDYPAINLSLDPEKQGQYFFSKVGPYDLWAIEFGYSTPLDDTQKEQERLNEILARSTEKQHAFGNDADDMRSPGKAIDPRVNVRELSSDVVRYSSERIELINRTMQTILGKYATEGQSYQELRNVFNILTYERSMASAAISRYIGGVYVERGFHGQSNAIQPFTPVPAQYQKSAMQALAKYLFAPDAFKVPEKLLNHLQMQRRGFDFFSQTEDFKIHNLALMFQTNVLLHLLHPNTLNRIVDSQMYGNTYTIDQVLQDLTAAIFNADQNGDINTFRQNLQATYTDLLINIVFGKSNAAFNHSVRSMALFQLNQIKKICANPSGNQLTKAHKNLLIHNIDQAIKK